MNTRAAAALLFGLLVGGCAGEAPLSVGASDCWGHAECAEALAPLTAALGGELAAASSYDAVAATDCGEVVDCAAAPDPTPTPRQPDGGSKAPEVATSRQTTTGAPEAPTTAQTPTPEPTPAPVASVSDPVPAASPGCADVSVDELARAKTLSPSDGLCLVDIAKGATSASDPDRQTAAIVLYNHKANGWGAAVDAALKRPGLRNAPRLNFAGIKPAYDGGRYSTVVSRSNLVWTNRGKSQLSDGDLTFLSEFACKSSAQLALQGKDPANGLDWCERWRSRAVKAGQDTARIDDLIDQLE